MKMSNKYKLLGEYVNTLSIVNIKLWHEEDKARSINDTKVARAKRAIDVLNQERNNLIEKIDELFIN